MRGAEHRLVIAIDGPSGAGKSTVGRLLADRLGYVYVDTGAMYRAVALKAEETGIDPEDEKKLANLCRSIEIEFGKGIEGLQVICNGEDVTQSIRKPSMGRLASNVSRVPVVRQFLVELQRRFGEKGGVILEGRDIGTVVFPGADLKFFLDADPRIRGERRHKELTAKGEQVDLNDTICEMEKRDARDRTRSLAPLRRAEDAILIDTTHLDIDGVVERMLRIYRDRLQGVSDQAGEGRVSK